MDATDPPGWYRGWVDGYRAAALLGADWTAAALLWWPTWHALGADGGDLAAAAQEVRMAPAAPRYPGDHLPAVKAALGRVRDRRRAGQDEAFARDRAGGDCPECGGTGHALVPHESCYRGGAFAPAGHRADGTPVYPEQAARCDCRPPPDPRAAGATQETLAAYTRRHPGWPAATLAARRAAAPAPADGLDRPADVVARSARAFGGVR